MERESAVSFSLLLWVLHLLRQQRLGYSKARVVSKLRSPTLQIVTLSRPDDRE